MKLIKRLNFELLFFAICFVGFFIFFTCVHQLVPYDGDDWVNLAAMRGAYPRWGTWNPIKILPETLMPFCGYLSAYLFYPLVNDYITSITLCSAFIVSAFITVYFYFFHKLIRENFQLPLSSSLCLTLILIFAHFMIFKSNKFNNTYMFFSSNLTCYFHYVIPVLLNSILILYLFKFKNFLKEVKIFKSSVLLLAVYLAIFSNVFHSIVLMACISIGLLLELLNNKNGKSFTVDNLKNFILNNASWFVLIGIWLISLLFEANGGRSNQIGRSLLALPIKETLIALGNLLKQTSKGFIAVFAVSALGALIIYLKSKEKNAVDYFYKNITVKSLLCCALTLVYVVLVSAKASPGYIGSSYVAFSFLVYLFVFLLVSLAYIFQKYPKGLTILPVLCLIVAVFTLHTDKHFRESNMRNIAPYKCVVIDNFLINQIVQADLEGKEEMELVVPKGDNRDNWPHPNYMGGNISRTLYAHGIISKNMKITIRPDENINKEYHLGYLK